MADSNVEGWVGEILSALNQFGEIENWLERRIDQATDGELMKETFREVTQRLLGTSPPEVPNWEHLIVAAAAHSAKHKKDCGYEACRTAIDELRQMIDADKFAEVESLRMITVASALTVVLAAQRKLRQPIEATVGSLAEKFPDSFPEMAQRCQDIWQRRGQMSGADGLYVWDTRRDEWRLKQDFRPLRPN